MFDFMKYNNKIKKWYFALTKNKNSKKYQELAKAAVLSAKKNTSLKPHLIYDSGNDDFTDWMFAHGVQVIHHTLSFLDKMTGLPINLEVARGAYLRFDIPWIEKEDQFILYTDVDVLFLKEIQLLTSQYQPPFFAACGELTFQNIRRGKPPSFLPTFNTGVMIMNLEKMQQEYYDLIQFCYRNKFNFKAFDQGALNAYMKTKNANQWNYLDHKLNYRICTLNQVINPTIVHFHGLKPFDVPKLKNRKPERANRHISDKSLQELMYDIAPAKYNYYYALFKWYRYFVETKICSDA